LVINFSSSALSDTTIAQIRQETNAVDIAEVHIPCQFKFGKPLTPQIVNMITLADKMAREAGFNNGLSGPKVIVPPGFADAAFIMGAWMAYAHTGTFNPIRTISLRGGWTAMMFDPKDSAACMQSDWVEPAKIRTNLGR
jgi:hypothetical protein